MKSSFVGQHESGWATQRSQQRGSTPGLSRREKETLCTSDQICKSLVCLSQVFILDTHTHVHAYTTIMATRHRCIPEWIHSTLILTGPKTLKEHSDSLDGPPYNQSHFGHVSPSFLYSLCLSSFISFGNSSSILKSFYPPSLSLSLSLSLSVSIMLLLSPLPSS